MTTQQYKEQNLAGFENDSFARDKFQAIITDNEIETVIETGTYLGGTTRKLAKMCGNVITIEVVPDHFKQAQQNIAEQVDNVAVFRASWDQVKVGLIVNSNVSMMMGSSEKVLAAVLPKITGRRLFFFLDAHWGKYNPLLDELAVIAENGLRPIIAIHDFKVPDHPELGFDTYGDIVYEWSWIENSIKKIYGENGFRIEYNTEATGAKRGIIYIYPVE